MILDHVVLKLQLRITIPDPEVSVQINNWRGNIADFLGQFGCAGVFPRIYDGFFDRWALSNLVYVIYWIGSVK